VSLMEEWDCEICGEPLGPDYKPAMCCSGFECGCRGMPTNPPICSQACWEKMLDRNIAAASSQGESE
jgi:hypothetical protein